MPIVTRKHRKQPSKHLKRIRAAVQAGKWKKAKSLTEAWLNSPEAKRLAVRLAYRAMPAHRRPHRSKLDAIAYALDPWKGSGEVVHVGVRSKKNSLDLRYIMNFGIEHRALQWLVLLVLRELVELHPSQYQTNPYGPRGTHPAIKQVKKALSEGYVWAIEHDIKDCYPSFKGKELSKFLPLPKKVIEAVLLCKHLNLKGGYSLLHSSGSVSCEKDDEAGANPLNDHHAKVRRGISQGSAASPFVAEALLSTTLHQIPNIGVIVAYADNILLLAKSKGDVASMAEALGSALEAHPAGPLYSKAKCFDPSQPIEFLGHKLTVKNGLVRIEPDDQNLQKFTHRVEFELASLNKTPLPTATRKKRLKKLEAEIRSWAGAFKFCDNVEALRAQWLAQASAQGNEAPKSVSEEQKPVTNTIKKTFKLHPDQKEIVEAALADVKKHTGTPFDTVALEYVCTQYMGTGIQFEDIKSHLNAEYKKAGTLEAFLEKVVPIMEKITGSTLTLTVDD